MRSGLIAASLILLLFATPGLAYDWTSVRILSLGEGLAGYVEDEFTDTFRNPAYLGLAGKSYVHNVAAPREVTDIGRNFMLGVSGPLASSRAFTLGGALDFEVIQRYRLRSANSIRASRLDSRYEND